MKKTYLIFIGLCLLGFSLIGGVRDFKMKQFGIEEDFEGIFIYSIVQDDKGYLWIGTNDGLYRYDGKKMLNLSKNDTTIAELVTASTSIGGDLFVGYNKGRVAKVNKGRFETILNAEVLASKINKIIEGEDDTIWVLSQNSGLAKVSGEDIEIVHQEFFSELISYSFETHGDEMFIATNEGLIIIKKNGDQLKFIEGLADLAVKSIYKDPYQKEKLWIGTEEGLYRYDLSTRDLERIPNLSNYRITSIVRDQLETLWVGTAQSGLVEIELKNDRPHKYTYFDLSHGFPSNQINSLFVDRENEVWVGTFGNGLVQLNRANFHHYELSKSASIEGIKDIYQVEEDLYYLATEKGLVKAFNQQGRDSLIFEKVKQLESYSVLSILIQKHIMWLGTANSGLVRFDTRSNSLKRIELNPVDPSLSHMVRYLAEGQDGSLWVSIAGNGAYNLTIEGKLIKHFNTRTGFYHNEIFAILPDDAGNVWFGAHTVGLAILKADGELDFLTKDEIFPGRNINSISQDDQGKIWIATAGEGLYGFDGEEFERFDESSGLISNYCNAVEVDNAGQIWVGHRMGLSLIQPEYKLVRKFDHPSELGETEAVVNSVEKDSSGNIWFGNPYGVTKVILPHLHHRVEDRETLIQQIRLYFSEVDLSKYSNEVEGQKVIPSEIEFDHNDNHITFDFVSINLRNPDEIYYQYKLEGYDQDWSPVTKSNSATFTNLDPGNYTFLVRESNHPEYWNDSIHKAKFRIDFPYWEKWWFYLIQIGFIMSIMIITIRLSQKIHNHFVIRLMVYISLFLIFEYIHTELEPYIDSIAGETPIFQVGINLVLALFLLPIELRLASYLKSREARNTEKLETATAK